MKYLITIITVLLMFSCATAPAPDLSDTGFNITFHNNTEELAIYRLAWVTHDFDYPFPVEMAVGEIKPGEKNEVNNGYSSGIWTITWYSCRSEKEWRFERSLNITDNVHQITSTPKEDTLK